MIDQRVVVQEGIVAVFDNNLRQASIGIVRPDSKAGSIGQDFFKIHDTVPECFLDGGRAQCLKSRLDLALNFGAWPVFHVQAH